MTGRHVHTIEAWDNASPLRCDWPTFAHSFRAAGYFTSLCGKMHFVGPDHLHGFEERWTFPALSLNSLTCRKTPTNGTIWRQTPISLIFARTSRPRVLARWNHEEFDEKRWASEERRLAILEALDRKEPPGWQVPSSALPHPLRDRTRMGG